MKILIELSGEAESLAAAEALGASSSAGEARVVESDGRALVIEGAMPARQLAGRLGLAWSVSEHIFSCDDAGLERSLAAVRLPPGSLRVRASRLHDSRQAGTGAAAERRLGAMLSGGHRIDLDSPDIELRLLMARRMHLGVLAREIDRSSFEARKAEHRPFNHPISLHPKLARALVNLTRVSPGEALLDPFCGTGGILIEAGKVGCRAIGGDIDRRMVDGTVANLRAFGITGADIRQADVSDWESAPGAVEAIATDPPYGRSASTASEPIESLYSRAFAACGASLRRGGRLAMVLPDERHAELAQGFEAEGMWPVRVHRSLTRYFCLFRKP